MISTLDRLFLERANELAARGLGNTSPNPPVGAVVVRGDAVLAEGYHHRAGEPHAEPNALAAAGDARGATLYVSLEPCAHVGRTPPCTDTILRAGIARVVVGAADPTRFGGGAAMLRESGVTVELAGEARARELVEIFAHGIESDRAYVALKMAASIDGYVASKPGVTQWVTCDETRLFVRSLRATYDGVLVGAGTVRVDDPQLTIRPPANGLRERVRIVACEREPVEEKRRIFTPVPGYARTIVLAPAGARARFAALERVADVLYVGNGDAMELDLAAALQALRAHNVFSVLCEGGPTLAGRLVAQGLVDRLSWIVAPLLLHGPNAVAALAPGASNAMPRVLRVERCEMIGSDAVITGRFADV